MRIFLDAVVNSKDTYKDICKYFGIRHLEEQISARHSKFYFSWLVGVEFNAPIDTI